jgi:signal transduction histidine kinase
MLRKSKLNEENFSRGLDTIERNAKLQAQLIDDLLDVSRIISGKLRLTVMPVELPPIIEAAVDSIRPAADAKRIRLQALLDSHAGLISGDPDRLQQVVWNLLSNAVKFTEKQGRIQVRLQRINSHEEALYASCIVDALNKKPLLSRRENCLQVSFECFIASACKHIA